MTATLFSPSQFTGVINYAISLQHFPSADGMQTLVYISFMLLTITESLEL
jgi:hypothetical protein